MELEDITTGVAGNYVVFICFILVKAALTMNYRSVNIMKHKGQSGS